MKSAFVLLVLFSLGGVTGTLGMRQTRGEETVSGERVDVELTASH